MSMDRVCIQVDLERIKDNLNSMHEHLSKKTKMIAVIKADAYGHGSIPIATKLESIEYLWGFAVATYEEAQNLRNAGIKKPILILGYTFPEDYSRMCEMDIRPSVFIKDQLDAMEQIAVRESKTFKVHIAVDTGMSRIGIRPDEAGRHFIEEVKQHKHLEVEGIFTHFAKADMEDLDATEKQYHIFKKFAEECDQILGQEIPWKHCCNSAGIIRFKQGEMDLVRAGITLYGLWPSRKVPHNIVLVSPALSMYSHVVLVKEIVAGTAVGYGGTFVAKHNMRVATIPVGYADGYPRSLSQKGYVLICGKKAKILGRICMDQFMVDVSDIPQAREGSLVTLIGTDKDQEITCEQLGEMSGRFHYELVCELAKRVPRIYSDVKPA